MRYSSYLKTSLKNRIEALHAKQQQALSLLDEVSVMQELCGQALGNYERAYEASLEIVDLESRMRVQAIATSYVVEVLNQVRDMTVAAARIQDSGKVVDMMTVHSVMAELMVFLECEAKRHLSEPELFLAAMNSHIQEHLLTVDSVATTNLTPERLDKEVMAMHDSVPEVA